MNDLLRFNHFERLLHQSRVPGQLHQAPYIQLLGQWTQAHRAYHNLEHLASCLAMHQHCHDLLDEVDYGALGLALWFHDAVYDPSQGDNEAKSALLAHQWLTQIKAPPSVVNTIVELVLSTAPGSDSEKDTYCLRLINDIDLSILAADAQTFSKYCVGIRQEYKHVPDDAYIKGRLQVLEHFHEKARAGKLFLMDRFKPLNEKAAMNLGVEIALFEEALQPWAAA